MKDHEIVDLYWKRDPEAIRETGAKYGGYCFAIARNILTDSRDSEECLNDTWLNAWNAMPEDRPSLLAPFLGKITRNLAFNRYRARRAEKRGRGELPAVLEELAECASSADTHGEVEALELGEAVDRFLHTLPERDCNLFLRRYWFAESMAEIGGRYGLREGAVRSSLFRSREKLRSYLQKEGLL